MLDRIDRSILNGTNFEKDFNDFDTFAHNIVHSSTVEEINNTNNLNSFELPTIINDSLDTSKAVLNSIESYNSWITTSSKSEKTNKCTNICNPNVLNQSENVSRASSSKPSVAEPNVKPAQCVLPEISTNVINQSESDANLSTSSSVQTRASSSKSSATDRNLKYAPYASSEANLSTSSSVQTRASSIKSSATDRNLKYAPYALSEANLSTSSSVKTRASSSKPSATERNVKSARYVSPEISNNSYTSVIDQSGSEANLSTTSSVQTRSSSSKSSRVTDRNLKFAPNASSETSSITEVTRDNLSKQESKGRYTDSSAASQVSSDMDLSKISKLSESKINASGAAYLEKFSEFSEDGSSRVASINRSTKNKNDTLNLIAPKPESSISNSYKVNSASKSTMKDSSSANFADFSNVSNSEKTETNKMHKMNTNRSLVGSNQSDLNSISETRQTLLCCFLSSRL